MNYTIMHKDKPVADIEINESAVAIVAIGTVHDALRVPLGVGSIKGGIALDELNDWLRGRSIPASRAGIRDLYARLGRESTDFLILKCYALSLSDHYWLRSVGSAVSWSNVNFFENDFSRDMGEMLFGREPADKKRINLMSPDNTSDGWLKKKWIVSDGKRKLIKGGSEPFKQEPFNEVIASVIAQRLGIQHVPYTLMFDEGEPLSVCDNFLSVETELITAWKVFHSQMMKDSDSEFTHFLRCCDSLGIVGVRNDIEKMLAFDYIIANEDRHFNNFGFIRNADTLEWVGFAPLFDSGTSLWHSSFDIGGQRKCQPFHQSHEEQLRLVSNLGWFDIDALKGVDQEIEKIFSRSPVIDKARSNAITAEMLKQAEAVVQRRRELHQNIV
ncbi:MAG: HipA domain-containing protein [Oscillospiraceae bacterium]|nr:HipA domain-containing protein [Oscillospiraceae bacterium]